MRIRMRRIGKETSGEIRAASPKTPQRVSRCRRIISDPWFLELHVAASPGLWVGLLVVWLAPSYYAADCPGVPFPFEERLQSTRSSRNLNAGAATTALASGDLNGDGLNDLIASTERESFLFTGRGDGTFAAAVKLSRHLNPFLAFDQDNDGLLDLVGVNRLIGALEIHRNQGEGRLELATTLSSVWFRPDRMISADLDGDGDLDMVLTQFLWIDRRRVVFVLNDGDEFAVVNGPYLEGRFVDLAVADLDGDGDLDLGFLSGERFVIFLNLGGGRVWTSTSWPRFDPPVALATGDMDGDGDIDFAIANSQPGSVADNVSLLMNDGKGGLERERNYFVTKNPTSIQSRDLDRDGDLDLLVISRDPASLSVLENDGQARFLPSAKVLLDGNVRLVTLADLDGDDLPDVVVAYNDLQTIDVLLNENGSWRFTTAPSGGTGPQSVSVGDFDGNGISDLVLVMNQGLGLLYGTGQGHFEIRRPTSWLSGRTRGDVIVADVEGDGDKDIILETADGPHLLVNNGTSFDVGELTIGRIDSALDFDADGDLDFARVLGSSIRVRVHDGRLGFGPTVTIPLGLSNPHLNLSFATGDLNGDGRSDLAVGALLGFGLSISNARLTIGSLLADGTPRGEVLSGFGVVPRDLRVADFDGDGTDDVVLIDGPGGRFQVLLGRGGGLERQDVVRSILFDHFLVADLDRDEDPDIVICPRNQGTLGFLWNDGNGRFGELEQQVLPDGLGAPVAGDLDGDGWQDLLFVDRAEDRVVMWLNRLSTRRSERDEDGNGIADICETRFVRGDCDGDGEVEGTTGDAIFLLAYNFLGGAAPPCLAACDFNADGDVEGQIADVVASLSYNFLGGRPPAAPFPDCGIASRESDVKLGCERAGSACR